MTVITSLWIGFIGSLAMFFGDMILYYSREDYDDKDTVNSIIGIMKNVNLKRLYLGGILGPVSAFLYCIGFYHIVLISHTNQSTIAWVVFFVNVLGLILGGAYHVQCAYLGILSRYENNGFFDAFLKFLKFQAKIIFPIVFLGTIGIAIMIALGYTAFPRVQALFTPIVLFFLTPLAGKLPKGFHMVIRGGWNNFIYVIYYLAAILFVSL